MPSADLEVVGVVSRRDLHRPAAEARIDVLVGDDRDAATSQRQFDLPPHEMPVAGVFGMDSDRSVAEHRLGAGGRDHDRVIAVAVSDRDQLTIVV